MHGPTVGSALAIWYAVPEPAREAGTLANRWRTRDLRHVTASPVQAAGRSGFLSGVGFAAGMRELAGAELDRCAQRR
jgi:hypothetical protein